MGKRLGAWLAGIVEAGTLPTDSATDPRFLRFLEKVKPSQPEEPKVWLGDTLFKI